ncbi:MAG: hypothetical protein D6759_16945, partial [Chloroflexi bacterium]
LPSSLILTYIMLIVGAIIITPYVAYYGRPLFGFYSMVVVDYKQTLLPHSIFYVVQPYALSQS